MRASFIHNNKPLPSCSKSLFRSEAKCKATDMKIVLYSHANKTLFHKKGFCMLPRFKNKSFTNSEEAYCLGQFLSARFLF